MEGCGISSRHYWLFFKASKTSYYSIQHLKCIILYNSAVLTDEVYISDSLILYFYYFLANKVILHIFFSYLTILPCLIIEAY